MMTPCSVHAKQRKGKCKSCGTCRLCVAPMHCKEPIYHRVLKRRGRKKCKLQGSSNLNGENSECDNKLMSLCSLLGLDSCAIPLRGFNAEIISKPGRSRQRAKKASLEILHALSKLLIPENPSAFHKLAFPKPSGDSEDWVTRKVANEKLLTSVLKCSLNSDQYLSKFGQVLLASSFDRNSCNVMLRLSAQSECGLTEERAKELEKVLCSKYKEECESSPENGAPLNPSETKYVKLRKRRAKIGQAKYASLRENFNKITCEEKSSALFPFTRKKGRTI